MLVILKSGVQVSIPITAKEFEAAIDSREDKIVIVVSTTNQRFVLSYREIAVYHDQLSGITFCGFPIEEIRNNKNHEYYHEYINYGRAQKPEFKDV